MSGPWRSGPRCGHYPRPLALSGWAESFPAYLSVRISGSCAPPLLRLLRECVLESVTSCLSSAGSLAVDSFLLCTQLLSVRALVSFLETLSPTDSVP